MPDDSPMKRLQASVQGSLENVQKMADGLQQNIAESPVKERIEALAKKGGKLAVATGEMTGEVAQTRGFENTWHLLFFVAAACVTVAGLMGIIEAMREFAPIWDFINHFWLFLFGLLQLIVDTPQQGGKGPQKGFAAKTRGAIRKYANFTTKLAGKGAWCMFLGACIVAALWDNGLVEFLGFFLGGYVYMVGGYAALYGVRLSLKLEQVRRSVQRQGWNDFKPQVAYSAAEFAAFAASVTQNRVRFTAEEMHYVCVGLSTSSRERTAFEVSCDDFEEWARGPWTIL